MLHKVIDETADEQVEQDVSLCVDLDGTLINTDLLLESALALISRQPLLVFALPFWLLWGRAYLKEQIAKRVTLDVSTLPYNRDFLHYLHEQHRAGRELVLTTATHKILADRVAEHVGIFSRVLATDNGINLSGERKRARVVEDLGSGNFDYAANDHVDVPVWSAARRIVLVNARPSVETRAREVGEVAGVFGGSSRSIRPYISALRPHQWAKNLLILIPALAGHAVGNVEILTQSLLALVSFCLCASSVYVANDLFDLEADRSHAKKRYRPFASGAIPLGHGMLMAPLLLLVSFAVAAALPLWFPVILAGYLLTTVAYTIDVKRRVMVDVIVLAILYTFRLLAGSAATGISLSEWLLAFSMFLFLSLALVKRYSELEALATAGDMKIKGRGYRVTDLPMIQSLGAASGYLAVLVLALYISSDDIHMLYATPSFLWGLCVLLLYWVSRTWMLTHRGKMNQDPVVFALTDGISIVVGIFSAAIIYLATTDMNYLIPFK